ncbi:inorganic diphosphatase [bacterium]|jgi:inorganic pyrophosphatase|nr:inorganic diphosphatase [bacterium]NBW56668.1 inorganic diphosphatase [bacterium]NBX72046.1 inorganic diphosphatase [bacterium]
MLVDKIGAGKRAPYVVNVVIEIPAMAQPIKYEIDKDSGALVVDRFLATPMFYPCNYGFIPGTVAGDNDPIDVLVWCPYHLSPGVVIASKIIGVLDMEDEAGEDYKLIAVPDSKISPSFDHINDVKDLPKELLDQIKHFFEHYKDLEPNKWVKVREFKSKDHAIELVKTSIRSL